MKKFAFIILVSLLLSSCTNPLDLFTGGGGDNNDQEERVIEPTEKFALAIGGVAPGRDELVLYDKKGEFRDLTGHELECVTDKDIIRLESRPSGDSIAAGNGVKIVPTDAGIATITCIIDNVPQADTYEVTISPQNLIQILMAEAGGQIADEATSDNNVVQLDSESKTGNAVGSVIRNRIKLIEANGQPGLFSVNDTDFNANPTVSYYDAVILANGQFSPTDPIDSGYQIFTDAQDRNFLSKDWKVAYDQIVLTAAGIYNEDIEDPTGGSFAFLSPTLEEWNLIAEALTNGSTDLPIGCGVTDNNFPALAPLQIVIMDGIWTYDDGRPSFIFIRHKTESDPAVISLR